MEYIRNENLRASLTPLLAFTFLIIALEQLPLVTGNIGTDFNFNFNIAQSLPFLTPLLSSPLIEEAVKQWTHLMSPVSLPTLPNVVLPQLDEGLSSLLSDLVSVIILIRMTKIVGVDRDAVIADKVAQVCREFPVRVIQTSLGLS